MQVHAFSLYLLLGPTSRDLNWSSGSHSDKPSISKIWVSQHSKYEILLRRTKLKFLLPQSLWRKKLICCRSVDNNVKSIENLRGSLTLKASNLH